MIVATINTIESAICQPGAASSVIRKNINDGAKKGISESIVAAVPVGFSITSVERIIGIIKVMVIGI